MPFFVQERRSEDTETKISWLFYELKIALYSVRCSWETFRAQGTVNIFTFWPWQGHG